VTADYYSETVSVYLGKGDGSFRPPIKTSIRANNPLTQLLVADFNHDGKLDLVVLDGAGDSPNAFVFLGDGTGRLNLSSTVNVGALAMGGMALGDVNGDGNPDLVITNSPDGQATSTTVLLGNGDGTFTQGSTLTDGGFGIPVLADFNGDGNLDIAAPLTFFASDLLVWLGNGNGTFGAATHYSTNSTIHAVSAADLNGDGKLDLITDGVDVLLGNGDGTFTQGASVPLLSNFEVPVAVGDFNGDGKLDVGVLNLPCRTCNSQVTLLLGDGKGNFRSPLQFPLSSPSVDGFSAADFNNDGLLDYVVGVQGNTPVNNVLLQGAAVVKPTSLDFGTVKVGSHSHPQTATLSNIGSSALKIKAISIWGDPTDFSETNHCGKSVPPHGSCKIRVTFSPQTEGLRTASLEIRYDGGSLLEVALSGTGKVITQTVTLTPSKMIFPTQLVGTKSASQMATLTNTGTQTVNISRVRTKAPFSESNNCSSTLDPGTSCQISVIFQPTQKGDVKGTLEVTDDAQGSPQKVALSGSATVVKLTPTSVNFGDQKVGSKSPTVPIKLTNVGKVALAISQIALTGIDPGDFSETNNCGTSVPAGGSCTIKVKFAPQKKGQRSADVSITDDGGGSPHQVGLFGNGT
jgi:hypothetical protein